MSALPERLRNGTRKLAPTCTGTLLPYSGSFFFVNKFIGWVLTHMFGEKHSEGSYVGSLTTGGLTTILHAC